MLSARGSHIEKVIALKQHTRKTAHAYAANRRIHLATSDGREARPMRVLLIRSSETLLLWNIAIE
jgi:hypothetical protein